MINAWKKLVQRGNNGASINHPNGTAMHQNEKIAQMPHGIQKLDKSLQRKFAKGVQYNMRLIIKGDSRVGKSCLFNRLKGGDFIENYTPTEDMQVTSIQWNYKATDDVVKIDVWEVADSGGRNKPRGLSPSLKLENDTNTQAADTNIILNNQSDSPVITQVNKSISTPLESASLDVYKGADAVIILFDMTKLWTFKYIQSELQNIPAELPILIVANHRDMGHHRQVNAAQVQCLIDGLNRYPHDGPVMYTETSMKIGFGMAFVQKFLNIPFLKLQEKTLVRQLEINRQEMCLTKEELTIMQETDEYEKYLELATIRRRQQADMLSPVPGALSSSNSAAVAAGMAVPVAIGLPMPATNSSNTNGLNKIAQHIVAQPLSRPPPSIIIGAKCSLPNQISNNTVAIGEIHKGSSHSSDPQQSKIEQQNDSNHTRISPSNGEHDNNDNDNDSDDNSDDDSPTANPLVANYQDDIDLDDMCDGIQTGAAYARASLATPASDIQSS